MEHSHFSYHKALRHSYQKAGNIVCLGLDPQWQKLPPEYRKKLRVVDSAAGAVFVPDCTALRDFLEASLYSLQNAGLSPAAFKPNLGYFQALDRPLLGCPELAFGGSHLLSWLQRYLSRNFPKIPIILDFKKGDIARSSANYAEEGFALWRSDALTVSPYMGRDSLAPFGRGSQQGLARHLEQTGLYETHEAPLPRSLSCGLPCGEGGVYSLLRTSNPGGRDLQNLLLTQTVSDAAEEPFPLYRQLAQSLLRWRDEQQIPALGAVVGATAPDELEQLAEFFARKNFPLLIPGVGKQGASFSVVLERLRQAGYPLELARINLSSGLLQSWPNEAPADWDSLICRKMEELLKN